MLKKITTGLLMLGSSLFANNYINNITGINTQQIGKYYNNNLIGFLLQNGMPYEQPISDTANLKLIGKKIYIENNKKAILIRVINKTNKAVDVTKEVGQGYAYPTVLEPFKEGWLIISNFTLNKPYKYDTPSVLDNLTKIISTDSMYKIIPYMIKNPIIAKFDSLSPKLYTLVEFKNWALTKGPLYIYERVDRIIDNNSNRSGLYLSGFLKVSNDLYAPVSMYFIINNGKIVKIFIVSKILKFKEFQTLILASSK